MKSTNRLQSCCPPSCDQAHNCRNRKEKERKENTTPFGVKFNEKLNIILAAQTYNCHDRQKLYSHSKQNRHARFVNVLMYNLMLQAWHAKASTFLEQMQHEVSK